SSKNFNKQILSVLRKTPDEPLNYKQISSRLGVTDPNARNQIVKNLAQLTGKNKVERINRGKYKLAGHPQYFEGVLDMTTRGKGYVITDELENDIFIPHKRLNKALDGDRVQVYCFGNPKNRKPEGEITKVVERKKTAFVGILNVKGTYGFVEVNNPKMY